MSAGCKIETPSDLRRESERLGVSIPFNDDISILAGCIDVGGRLVPNRFCVQPMEGHDGLIDGSPGPLTCERYAGYARGGFGLIWFEATAVTRDGRSGPHQLYINRDNVQAFRDLVRSVRAVARHGAVLVLQLSHAGRFSAPDGVPAPVNACDITDQYIDGLRESYVDGARLAAEAGFDGVDIKSCHRDLVCDLLNLQGRGGAYGGDYGNRTRFIRETFAGIVKKNPGLFVTTRLGVKDENDVEEKIRLTDDLRKSGMPLVSISVEDSFIESGIGRWDVADAGGKDPAVDPLRVVAKAIDLTSRVQRAFPDMPVVGGCYSRLGCFIPQVSAGVIGGGGACFAGIGRAALAYPDMVNDILAGGRMDPAKCCISCSACMQILRTGGNVGCVIRNDLYGQEYRRRRRFALSVLRSEADRCHDCENAACVQACPAGVNIPGFIKAFAVGDMAGAYGIIRERNVLPEMCSLLCPVAMLCEGACIETAFTGRPVAIADLQYAVSRAAREKGDTGVNVSGRDTGRRIAVIGAGPAGVSCAVKLLEPGHEVVIFEAGVQTGGTPETLMRPTRFWGGREEIDAVLLPALRAGRLEIRYQNVLGRNVKMSDLREDYDAVLLASGLWRENSLGRAGGVVDAVEFLKECRAGRRKSVPARVVILSGGDCAMDAAATVMELGAEDLFIVYAGSMSEMHWHMEDAWFRTAGVHCLFLNQPVGYETDGEGRLKAVRLRGVDPAGERFLAADMVIEAMGLGIDDGVQAELAGIDFTEYGLIKTRSADSSATALDGVFAAGGLVNGGATVVQCIAEGMRAAAEINDFCNMASWGAH